jgi:hypothetical protein
LAVLLLVLALFMVLFSEAFILLLVAAEPAAELVLLLAPPFSIAAIHFFACCVRNGEQPMRSSKRTQPKENQSTHSLLEDKVGRLRCNSQNAKATYLSLQTPLLTTLQSPRYV